jgi:hypothetical protein
MTSQTIKTDPVAWEQAMHELRVAEVAKNELGDDPDLDEYEVLADRYDRAKDKVLEQHAPDIEAVIAKLQLLFAEEIGSDFEIYDVHKLVIGDLYRLWLDPKQSDE